MPPELQDLFKKYKSKLNFLALVIFVVLIGLYFWNTVRPKLLFTSCSEIALNTSYIQARTSVMIDTTRAYEVALNDCLIQTGVSTLEN